MSETLQLVVVSLVAAGALGAITRPFWSRRASRANGPAPTPGCDKCAGHETKKG
jgi:hypothetical protein